MHPSRTAVILRSNERIELRNVTQQTLGAIPNLAKVLAASPASPKTWLESIRALAGGQLER